MEYLPESLGAALKKESNIMARELNLIDCRATINQNAKCKSIQNQLRPFNYDLEAWQLAHPHLMYNSRPELFFDSNSKDIWIKALKDKIGEVESDLLLTKLSEPNKEKRISRLEVKEEKLKEVFTPSVVKTAEIENKEELDELLALYKRICKRHNEYNNQSYGYLNCKNDACAFGIGELCSEHKNVVGTQKTIEQDLLKRIEELQSYTTNIEVLPK